MTIPEIQTNLFQVSTFFPSKGPKGSKLNIANTEFIKIDSINIQFNDCPTPGMIFEFGNNIRSINDRKLNPKFVNGPTMEKIPVSLTDDFPKIMVAPGPAIGNPIKPAKKVN